MSEQNVQFPVNGEQGMGFLAKPDGVSSGRGVVVIQEWWGLNNHIKDIVKRFAAQGYIALAPDLYHGRVVSEPNDAQKEAMGLDRPRAIKEIDGAATYLKSLPEVNPKKIGVVGFCMGGGLALHTAAHNQDIGAVAAFYGGGSPDASAFANSTAAILNINGELDQHVTATIHQLEEGLKQYPLHHEMIIYPGGQHAFFNNDRPEVYKADAAQDAWNRTLNWFQKYLV